MKRNVERSFSPGLEGKNLKKTVRYTQNGYYLPVYLKAFESLWTEWRRDDSRMIKLYDSVTWQWIDRMNEQWIGRIKKLWCWYDLLIWPHNMTVDRQNEREAEREEMTSILDISDNDFCLILSSPVSVTLVILRFTY